MKPNEIISGEIIGIFKTRFLVKLPNNFIGQVHISEVSDYYVANINLLFRVGQNCDFLILSLDNEHKKAKLSWKRIMPRYQNNPFQFNIKETINGFKNLKEFVEKEVKSD